MRNDGSPSSRGNYRRPSSSENSRSSSSSTSLSVTLTGRHVSASSSRHRYEGPPDCARDSPRRRRRVNRLEYPRRSSGSQSTVAATSRGDRERRKCVDRWAVGGVSVSRASQAGTRQRTRDRGDRRRRDRDRDERARARPRAAALIAQGSFQWERHVCAAALVIRRSARSVGVGVVDFFTGPRASTHEKHSCESSMWRIRQRRNRRLTTNAGNHPFSGMALAGNAGERLSPRLSLLETRRSMRQHACNAVGCRALVLPTELFCRRHDAMLQSDLRALLARTYRPSMKPSKVFQEHLALAVKEILYAQTEGHRAPRAGSFEW